MKKKHLLKPLKKTPSVSEKKKRTLFFIALYYLAGWILNEAFKFSIIVNYLYCFIPILFYFFYRIIKKLSIV